MLGLFTSQMVKAVSQGLSKCVTQGHQRGEAGQTSELRTAFTIKTKPVFLSQAECQFCQALKGALPPGLWPSSKVQLQGVYARFQAKCIDFLMVAVKDYLSS